MGIIEVLYLLLGLALFLYGMDVMGDSLKKSAGSRLKAILSKMTSSPLRGFLLGLGVTTIIQSSSATTVMVVGFVNSGTMLLTQAVGVIMGANVGTAVTAWLTALSGLGGDVEDKLSWIKWLKPDSWMPILAVVGICLIMFTKRGKKKDIGNILLGFAILMVGMNTMSEAVSELAKDPSFTSILTMFSNPILGLLAGLVLTAVVQSSSASVGILQSLTVSGVITYGAAIPIVMGQNIGTCVTALLSALSAGKNGKRAAIIHLYFNIIGVIFWLSTFYIVDAFANFAFVDSAIDMWGVAGVHTIFKILSVIAIAPFYKQLEKLSILTIRDKKDENDEIHLLDERLFETPAIAVERSTVATYSMAKIACEALKKSLVLFDKYDPKLADEIRDLENKADQYEDQIGSYLVKLSAYDMTEQDSNQVTKLLHMIGDFERISDHAVNIVESAEEMKEKKIEFSAEANADIAVMKTAVSDIVDMTYRAFVENDLTVAENIEPLEEVVDDIRDEIKLGHILRLQKSECSIEHGFVLSDVLNNFERVSDHCSNIAGCVIEISKYDALSMHEYIEGVKNDGGDFNSKVAEYKKIYSLKKA